MDKMEFEVKNRTISKNQKVEGDYDYDKNDPNDMLNVLDLDGSFMQDIDSYNAYVQNVDAGVYIIVAKEFQVLE